MRDTNRTGGVAALVQAVFFLLIPVVFVLVLPRVGLTLADQGDPAKMLSFTAKNSLLLWFDAAIVVAAAAVVALALVMRDRLREAAPFATRYAVIAASIGAALFIGGGIADIYDLSMMSHAYTAGGTEAAVAAAAYMGVGTLALGLFWAAMLAYGVSVVVLSWVALQAHVFAPVLNYLGLAWGVLAILTVFAFVSPTLYLLALLAPIVGILWAGWMAWGMLGIGARVRVSAPARSQRPAAPPA